MTWFDAVTVGLVVGTAAAWIAWDVVLGVRRQKTESMWIAQWSRQFNVLPFAIGTLVGHWFVQSPEPDYRAWPAAVACAIGVLGFDLVSFPWPRGAILNVPKWLRYPGLWLAFGVPVGHFFWPQRYP